MVYYPMATEEQKEYAEVVRTILNKELKPRLHELELANDGLGQYPMDVHKIMAEAGFYAMNMPEEWGGLNLDMVTRCIIMEEMAQVDAAFAFDFYNAGAFFPEILATGIPDEEKQMWADKHLSGEAIGAFCVTESEAGSDAAAMKTKAVKDGNEWVINGSKCFISRGPIANFFLVAAWTDKTKRASQGVTFFFVEGDRPGISIGKQENKMGMKLAMTSDVIFQDVRVLEDHVVGEVGKGFGHSMSVIGEEGRLFGSSYALGMAQAALDAAIDYAKQRRTFGKRIIDHEGLGFLIADMKIRTQAARALLYQACAARDAGVPIGDMANSVKVFVSDSTMQTTTDAVQVLGGYGYMKDYGIEKLMRDAKIFQIFSGTNQIIRRTIAKNLAGKDPQKTK